MAGASTGPSESIHGTDAIIILAFFMKSAQTGSSAYLAFIGL
jgi:hypothetical protein